MPSRSLSRRGFVTGVSGAVLLPLAATAEAASVEEVPGGEPATGERFAGLERGTVVARWVVAHVAPLECGGRVLSLAAVGAESEVFEVEVLARDDAAGAATPPGLAERFAVFVRNAGRGQSQTIEEHGLAARAIAEHLDTVAASADASGLMTHAARSRAFAADLAGDSRTGPPRLLRR